MGMPRGERHAARSPWRENLVHDCVDQSFQFFPVFLIIVRHLFGNIEIKVKLTLRGRLCGLTPGFYMSIWYYEHCGGETVGRLVRCVGQDPTRSGSTLGRAWSCGKTSPQVGARPLNVAQVWDEDGSNCVGGEGGEMHGLRNVSITSFQFISSSKWCLRQCK